MVERDLTNGLTIRDVLNELEKTRIPLLSKINEIRSGSDDDKLEFVKKCECFLDVYTSVKPTNHKDLRIKENAIESLNKAIELVKLDNPELFS